MGPDVMMPIATGLFLSHLFMYWVGYTMGWISHSRHDKDKEIQHPEGTKLAE